MRWIWRTALAGTLVLSTAGCGRVLAGAVAAAPAFLPISDEQEMAVGLQAAQQVVQQVPVVNDQTLQTYVQAIGNKLAAASDRPNIPYHFTVVQDDQPNAFALPGGYIFITSGMLKLMDNEAQLAGVLAHEIGHVAGRHAIELIREEALAKGVQVAALGTDAGTTQAIANVVRQLVALGYGRSKELEADTRGVRYAAKDHYDPQGLAEALQRLGQVTGSEPAWLYPLSTHPPVEQRIQALQSYISQNQLTGTDTHPQAYLQATASIR